MNDKNKDIKCTKCNLTNYTKNGTRNGVQQYWCKDCNKPFTISKRNTVKKQLIAISLVYNNYSQAFAAYCVKRDKKTIQRWLDDFRSKHINAPTSKNDLMSRDKIELAIDKILWLLCKKLNSQETSPEKSKLIKEYKLVIKMIKRALQNKANGIRETTKLDGCFID